MSSELITELDSTFGNEEVETAYPHIFIETKNPAALPLVLDIMEEGDTPVYFEDNGETYELKRVLCEPLNLLKLLRVYPFKFFRAEEDSIDVTDNIKLLEACM